MCQGLVLGQSQVSVKQALAYGIIFLRSTRHSPSHRRMNFETGERKSPSHPSRGGQVDITEAEAKEEGEGTPVENEITTSKAEQLRHLSSGT
eukprot:14779531-Ditylum_brightwellii.AAC.1